MKVKELNKLRDGLYKVYWKSGGFSLAAKGSDKEGNAWFAFTNWISNTSDRRKYAANIERLALIADRKFTDSEYHCNIYVELNNVG